MRSLKASRQTLPRLKGFCLSAIRPKLLVLLARVVAGWFGGFLTNGNRTMETMSAEEHRDAAPGRWRGWGIVVVLALTFAAYAPTLTYQFVHDDRGQIVDNPAVHTWSALPSYFTAQVWAGIMPWDKGNYYRPLFLIWLRINEMLFGNHAWGWHLTTVLAHVLVTLLVYLLALGLRTGRDVALMSSLIFGLHPVHIEGVAWISGVTEPLLGILLISSFLFYLNWRAEKAVRWQLLSLATFALAILEKETALILPGLLLAYEWTMGRDGSDKPPVLGPQANASGGLLMDHGSILRWCGQNLKRIWPYFVPIAIYIPMRIHALQGFSHAISQISVWQVVLTWPLLIAFWIRHLIWPAGLATFYNLTVVGQPTFGNFTLPMIFDLAVAIALIAFARKSLQAKFFAAWLVLPLIPPLNLRVFLSDDFAHDRYLYLPVAGFAVLLAMLLRRVCNGPPRWFGLPARFTCTGLVLAAAMIFGINSESSYFKDNMTFYAYTLTKTPHNPYAESNYGILLAERGRLDEALKFFLDAVHCHPDYFNAAFNLGLTYYKLGRLPEAEQSFLRAIHIDSGKPDTYFYLGLTLLKSGRTPEAISCLRQAIALHPTGYAYHFALGVMLKTQGDLSGARREFREELANYPQEQSAAQQVSELEGK